MAVPAYYNTGTATLTNGSTTMTGSGTAWSTAGFRAGDRVIGKDGKTAFIGSVNSDTSITLSRTWQGTSQTTDVYELLRTSDAVRVMEAARTLLETLTNGVLTTLAALSGVTAKATPVDADLVAIWDSAASFVVKKLPWADLKATLWSALGALIAGGTTKATPVDADKLALSDSAASNATKYLSWANLKATLWSALGALIAGGTTKATPVDADKLALSDSAASNATKYLSWANLKATLKTYFDTLYVALTGAQTVAGDKTFSGRMAVNGAAIGPGLVAQARGGYNPLSGSSGEWYTHSGLVAAGAFGGGFAFADTGGAPPGAGFCLFLQDSGANLFLAAGAINAAPTKRLNLNASGELQVYGTVFPNADDSYDLGKTDKRFDDVYATNGTIQTSDIGQKSDVEAIPNALALARLIQPIRFRWKDIDEPEVIEQVEIKRPVTEKVTQRDLEEFEAEGGKRAFRAVEVEHDMPVMEQVPVFDEAGKQIGVREIEKTETVTIEQVIKPARRKTHTRKHLGFSAQQVEQALADSGIDTADFAAFVHDPETGFKGLRSHEMLPLLWQAFLEEVANREKLEARIAALEGARR